VTLTPSTNYSRGTIKRMRRHGRDHDIVLDQYTKASRHPVPFGLLVRSHKTGKFVWFDRTHIHTLEYEMLPTHSFYDEFDAYTSDYDLFDEYLDHIIKVVAKRDKNKFALVKSLYRKSLKCPQN
jgi:hypothetical protein